MRTKQLAIALLTVLAACGGGGGESSQSSPTSTADAQVKVAAGEQVQVDSQEASGGPGQVEVAIDDVTGGTTQIMLAIIHQGDPQRPLGTVCGIIDDDPWSFSRSVFQIEQGGSPCDFGTTPVVFDPGEYRAFFGVYTGGERYPDQCAEVEFEVAGDTRVIATELVAPCDLYN